MYVFLLSMCCRKACRKRAQSVWFVQHGYFSINVPLMKHLKVGFPYLNLGFLCLPNIYGNKPHADPLEVESERSQSPRLKTKKASTSP